MINQQSRNTGNENPSEENPREQQLEKKNFRSQNGVRKKNPHRIFYYSKFQRDYNIIYFGRKADPGGGKLESNGGQYSDLKNQNDSSIK